MIYGYSSYSNVSLIVSYLGTGAPQNSPPVANFHWVTDQLTAAFDDGSVDSDGIIATWAWNFGDGSLSDAPSPEHSYEKSGEYTVTLAVTDDDIADPKSDIAIATVSVIFDADGDNVADDGADACLDTPDGESVDDYGCAESQKDDDVDGVANDVDECPATPNGETVDTSGCAESQKDDDGDGVANDVDQCASTSPGDVVDVDGCTVVVEPPPPVACDGSTQRYYNRIRRGRTESFTVDVPGCASEITFTTSGSRGDVDLQVDGPGGSCSGTSNSSNETCTLNGSGGLYLVTLRAYTTSKKVTAAATWK
jgi:PKD repeat protein